jgi:hypothetical protein
VRRIVDADVERESNMKKMAAAYKTEACKAKHSSRTPFAEPYSDDEDDPDELAALAEWVSRLNANGLANT